VRYRGADRCASVREIQGIGVTSLRGVDEAWDRDCPRGHLDPRKSATFSRRAGRYFRCIYQRPFPAPGRPDVGRSLRETDESSVRSLARTVNATVRQRMAIKRERLRAVVS
jgi:hypothetical protein